VGAACLEVHPVEPVQEGARLEREIADLCHSSGARLMGPNCQGLVSTEGASLYAHMPPQFPSAGPVGVVSQSGNLATSFITAGEAMGVGFSRIISSGNEADLQTTDFLEALADDPATEVILSYLEGVRDGRTFVGKSREVSRQKPFIMVKAGQTEAGVKAAFSHTGALSGSDDLFRALFSQAGVIRAETIEEAIDLSAALVSQPLPKGRRLYRKPRNCATRSRIGFLLCARSSVGWQSQSGKRRTVSR